MTDAPGWPGIPPRWTSSDKSGIGTSLSGDSRLWFTLSHGVVNEIYYPRIDRACTRDLGFIVADGRGFVSEEKRHAHHDVERTAAAAPAYRLVSRCSAGRYRIEKEVISDPTRPALLQRIRYTTTPNDPDCRLHMLLAPHLGNRGAGNTAWLDEYKGVPMLFAERDGYALAVASSAGFAKRSVGFVGTSDGWTDLCANQSMQWEYQRAENGNVAMMAQLDVPADGAPFMLAAAFGVDAAEAGHRARAALHDGFDQARAEYVRQWDAWQDELLRLDDSRERDPDNRYRISTIVMRTHESTGFPGGIIASLAIPWGSSKGDEDLGGYHLVWPRDLVETAGGLLAAGAKNEVQRVLSYLQTTQEADGHWGQNMWLDGTPYWNGIQMDETALPILLVDLAQRHGALAPVDVPRFRHMVRRAAGYIVRNGPVSPQDRWEEDPGYSPFTVAAQIAALLVAASLADDNGAADDARYLRETADAWYDSIDRWMYATGTDRATRFDVEGYYVRIAPVEPDNPDVTRMQSHIPVRNVDDAHGSTPAAELVSPDALALVRFGLRRADDPRMVNTVRLIDSLLQVDTPKGPLWRRYNGDGYGEHDDGSPFDGTGIGRAWPLLTGERAHYELAAGRPDVARTLLDALERFTSDGGLMPEQIWDAPDLPERELFFGCPAGSAMPLVWAHAEYVKLLRSLRDGRVFDTPPQTVERYLERDTHAVHAIWRFNHRTRSIAAGRVLRLEVMASAVAHWSADHWGTTSDIASRDTGFGVHVIDVPTAGLAAGSMVCFTLHWSESDRWEGTDFQVEITGSSP